jgi:2-polyprenyl-6-methoxyphenol hydroxylase-like FAD-dependent oxidoreductase
MAENGYDAIVVGARCAGSPTAMLLARKGYKVLVVDRARFPSDTVSTHIVHPPGVSALRRWGLLDRLWRVTGTVDIDTDGRVRRLELTSEIATLEPPPPEMQQVLGAVHGNQDAMDGFARVMAGVTSPAEFFSEENAGRILAAAH